MKAGPEIGVASTKAFTVQLCGLLLLVAYLGRARDSDHVIEKKLVSALQTLPAKVESALIWMKPSGLWRKISQTSNTACFGTWRAIPDCDGRALKLKEISYIHAEAYAAGELKHGPLALIDAEMPVIVVAPNNELLEKLHPMWRKCVLAAV